LFVIREADGTAPAVMAGKSNMELLLRDEDRIDSVLSKWWNPAAAATIGLVSIVFLRAFQRRPLYSGTYFFYVVPRLWLCVFQLLVNIKCFKNLK